MIHQVSRKSFTLSDSVRDVNVGFITDNSTKVERWLEHFESESSTLSFSSLVVSLPSPTFAVSCDPTPSEGEVAEATQGLRNKASGDHDILTEIYKSCQQLVPWLYQVIE
ncbi:unnamed protein product [Schistocephalus solidus]|uniref:Uncharacterized protein n=1 Tax=Schistocephalus solidus TaxID=70667 RepID=A0A183TEP9_SCHSO|nr:unnamed protein product [Schistocephalus solidus]